MTIKMCGVFAAAALVVFSVQSARAETVDVKYRGPVLIDTFDCSPIKKSSFVKRICYDASKKYLIVKLKSTYYHYCEIDSDAVSDWRSAPSLGRYYNQNVKGAEFDCRGKTIPAY